MYANKWFYIMGDFSRKTGLQVYSDGELVDGDVLGTNGNHVKSDNPQNFFVGSSVNQGAHARFQLASISTFKGALSPKTISHIYSYFWRQGEERTRHLVALKYGNHLLLPLIIYLFPSKRCPGSHIQLRDCFSAIRLFHIALILS